MPAQEGPSRVVVAIVALFLGGFGIHKFMMGQTVPGIIMLVGTMTICGAFIVGPIALVEAIIYLTKSDEDFYQTYIVGKKAWF